MGNAPTRGIEEQLKEQVEKQYYKDKMTKEYVIKKKKKPD